VRGAAARCSAQADGCTVQSAVVVGSWGCAAHRSLGPVRSAFARWRASAEVGITDQLVGILDDLWSGWWPDCWLAVMRQASVCSMVSWETLLRQTTLLHLDRLDNITNL
jgi:hypothetical protein